ncbi:MAG TPA: MoaD/ThiS family protein [Candidatus Nanoarchaeia archaeon]|nr:MoaD/ThiS family protein [Candidatus Nanoarchaeia archaeon]
MRVEIDNIPGKERKSIEIKAGSRVKDALEKLGINPVAVIVAVNGSVSIQEKTLKNRDRIKIIPVVSGG